MVDDISAGDPGWDRQIAEHIQRPHASQSILRIGSRLDVILNGDWHLGVAVRQARYHRKLLPRDIILEDSYPV